METLNSTEPHYVRCVKPNSLNRPQKFENTSILHQLRCGVSCTNFYLFYLLGIVSFFVFFIEYCFNLFILLPAIGNDKHPLFCQRKGMKLCSFSLFSLYTRCIHDQLVGHIIKSTQISSCGIRLTISRVNG